MKFGSVGSHNGNNKLTRLFYNYISLYKYHIKMIFITSLTYTGKTKNLLYHTLVKNNLQISSVSN